MIFVFLMFKFSFQSDRSKGARGKRNAHLPKTDEWTAFCKFSRTGHKEDLLALALSTCGSWIVSCSLDKSIIFWDSRTGHAQFVINTGSSGACQVSYFYRKSQDMISMCVLTVESIAMTNGTQGGVLAAVGADNQPRLCEYKEFKLLTRSPVHP